MAHAMRECTSCPSDVCSGSSQGRNLSLESDLLHSVRAFLLPFDLLRMQDLSIRCTYFYLGRYGEILREFVGQMGCWYLWRLIRVSMLTEFICNVSFWRRVS